MDERLIALEARFDTVLPTLATKADVEALRADIHKWMVGTMIGLFIGFAGLFIAMNNTQRQAPVAAAGQGNQPVVVYLSTLPNVPVPPVMLAPPAPAVPSK